MQLSSTARLSQDVVSDFPLLLMPANSTKLRFKYSLLVRQFAQTPEEYAYWEQLKATTENLGSLFDPAPTQLTGNVRCLTDESEPVIGYVGASTVTEKRIFISSSDLPPTNFLNGYSCLPPDTVLLRDVSAYFSSPAVLPVYGVYSPMGGLLLGYAGAPADCVDCRRRGTNKRPDFWQ
ncbi:DUF4249 domain-containing protein [Hymenobacter cellulosilyticus]|uniref:DUF4249 domain-containing protein n=1 Tax=Hymenobacter cellulosilyticus TaxID=2932248 RepID=A0A8T9QBR0_9BACT|nr:DUF4249 domain-containing protein [Hymenobacter cellulosilyticus]